MRLGDAVSLVMVGCVAAVLVVWGAALVWDGGRGSLSVGMAVGMSLIVLAHGFPASACARTHRIGRHRWAMIAGVVFAGLGAVGWCLFIALRRFEAIDERAAMAPLVLSAAAASYGVLAVFVRRRVSRRLTRLLRMIAFLLAIALIAHVLGSATWLILNGESIGRRDDEEGELMIRIGAVIALALGGVAVALAISDRWSQLATGGDDEALRFDVELECPRCGHRQTVGSGESTCDRCSLLFRIEAI